MSLLKNRKINFRSFSIRLFVSFLSTLIGELGIGCYYGCGLGTDPISVFVDGMHNVFGLSYGDISTICNIILVILIFIFEREHLGPGTLIAVAIAGPLIDVFETLVRVNFPLETTSLFVRFVILIVGLITTSISYALAIACKMGIGTFQFVPIFLSDKTPLSLEQAQTVSDALFFAIGACLGGVIGIGTIVGVLCTGYLMGIVMKLISKPLDDLGEIFTDA